MRTLRTKKHRAFLWYAADGKCQICGKPLGDDWHADHIIPWSVSQQTNVHDMQALCRTCNLKKGDKVFIPRQHQKDFERIVKDIRARSTTVNKILVSVTPGGGKSVLPVLVAKELIPGRVDKICWIVPRVSLITQAEEAFADGRIRHFYGHTNLIRGLIKGNEVNPSRDTQGYAATYDAVMTDADTHIKEFERHRYALILDEPHHIKRGGKYEVAIREIIDRAHILVAMSGTWERGDKGFISDAVISYQEMADGAYLPDFSPTPHSATVRYSRVQALKEEAIKQLVFEQADGYAKWVSPDGTPQEVESIAESGNNASAAIFTALHTAYSEALLEKGLEHWQSYQATTNRHAKMLIVVHGQARAKTYYAALKDRGLRVGLAISDEGKDAVATIGKFKLDYHKPKALDILVTVAMAYEGLDVPSVTHLISLTHIRSKPWIEQMLARAARVDRKCGLSWKQQYGFIFAPDDPLFNKIAQDILQEQQTAIREKEERTREMDSPGSEPVSRDRIAPLASGLTRMRGVDGVTGESVSYEGSAILAELMQENGIQGVSIVQMHRVVTGFGTRDTPVRSQDIQNVQTPSEKEKAILEQIEKACRSIDRYLDAPFGTTNKAVVAQFGKGRPAMTFVELCAVWKWINVQYNDIPFEGRERTWTY